MYTDRFTAWRALLHLRGKIHLTKRVQSDSLLSQLYGISSQTNGYGAGNVAILDLYYDADGGDRPIRLKINSRHVF